MQIHERSLLNFLNVSGEWRDTGVCAAYGVSHSRAARAYGGRQAAIAGAEESCRLKECIHYKCLIFTQTRQDAAILMNKAEDRIKNPVRLNRAVQWFGRCGQIGYKL